MSLEALSLILNKDLGLEPPAVVSEQQILEALESRVRELLLQDAVGFLQLMYRLDIDEKGMRDALDHKDAPERLAGMIYARQMEKVQTRARFRAEGDVKDDELKW